MKIQWITITFQSKNEFQTAKKGRFKDARAEMHGLGAVPSLFVVRSSYVDWIRLETLLTRCFRGSPHPPHATRTKEGSIRTNHTHDTELHTYTQQRLARDLEKIFFSIFF